MTKPFGKLTRWLSALGLLAFGLFWGGCRSVEPVYQDVPASSESRQADTYIPQIGEWLEVKYSGIGMPAPPTLVRVSDKGTIALPDIGTITVTNKAITELEKELTSLYRKYYNHLYVRITPLGRVYYVAGEVRTPGPKAYFGKTTVSTAIQAAGDFTKAANKKKVKLIRSDGRSESIVVVDLSKAIHPTNEHSVRPGDKIEIPRKWWH